MRDVRRQRVRQWTGALVLALPFVVVTALETTARLATIHPPEQILQRATGILAVKMPGGENRWQSRRSPETAGSQTCSARRRAGRP